MKKILGIISLGLSLFLVACQESKPLNKITSDEFNYELNETMIDTAKKLTSKNTKILGLSFNEINVKSNDNRTIFSTEVTNHSNETVKLSKNNLEITANDKKYEMLSEDILIFEDECILLTFETEKIDKTNDLKIKIHDGIKEIVFI